MENFEKKVENMVHRLEEKIDKSIHIYKIKQTFEDVESYVADKSLVKFVNNLECKKQVKSIKEAIKTLEELGYEVEFWKDIVSWQDGIITVC